MACNKTTVIALCAVWAFAGCAPPYTLQEAGRTAVGGVYSVETRVAWNAKSTGNATVWTDNGIDLDRTVFFNGVEDGQPLFGKSSIFPEDKPAQRFKSDMSIIEIAELFANTMQTEGGWFKIEKRNMKAQNFGPFAGFAFDMNMTRENGLAYKGLTAGAVIEKKLYMIFFLAPELSYYPRYIDAFKDLLSSIQKTSG